MSNDQSNANDPLGFMRNMWGSMGFSLPGMVTPTFDVNELDKRIKDLKAVEGWLRMNLTMLQATIQGLEMQVGTLNAVKAMGNMAAGPAPAAPAAPAGEPGSAEKPTPEAADAFSQAALWPWQMMQQMQEQLLHQAEAAKASQEPAPAAKKSAPKRPRKPSP